MFRILLSLCAIVGISAVGQDFMVFSEKQSYYEITSKVDLRGKTVTLPENAWVVFRGGKVSNGVIICHNNTLTGRDGIESSVVLKGSVKGPLDISVFCIKVDNKDYDIGRIINLAGSVCKNLIVPEGRYYLQTPVRLENIKYYEQYGDLIYNGGAKDVTVFQFYGGGASIIKMYGKLAYDTSVKVINYTISKKTNIIGVEFVNFNNSDIFIGDVEYFNNNIRISGYGAGNCYNKYTFNISVFSNEHLRIFQKNQPEGQIGWCNENTFIGGRFCNWSHFDWNNCKSVAIRIEGDDKSDTYNSANSLLFIKPCMEGFKDYAIYAKNVIGCHWQDARTEGSKVFIKFEGSSRDNEANSMYGTEIIDYSGCTTYPLKMAGLFPIYSTSSTSPHIVVEVNTATTKRFRLIFNGQDTKGRVGIQYLADNQGRTIEKVKQKDMVRPRSSTHPNSFYYSSNSSTWMLASDSTGSDFVIPDDVDKILLTVTGNHSGFTIYSDQTVQVSE